MTQTTAPRSLWQGGAPAPAKHVRRASNSLRQPALMAFFAFEVICLTVLQKFAIPVNLGGAGGPVQVALPLTYAALFVLLFFVKFSVDRQRVVLLTGALIFAFVTIAMVPGTYSTNSVMLMVLIYLPFILYIEVSEATYHKLIKIYLNAMIIFGAIAMLEQVAQLIWSWEVWPNLDYIIPSNFQMEGFVYIQPFQYGSHFMKPNGIFFLEVSYLSQWTAIALALELVYFRRTWRMSFYAVVLLSCLAGTGLLLLLVCAPVLLSRVSKRSLAVVGVVFLVCVITAISINWVQNVQHRFTEVEHYNSSANHRFVVPFEVLANFAQHPESILIGEGPGNGAKEKGDMWWAFTKVAYEYGFIDAIMFTIFLCFVLFKKAPSARIAFLLIIFFNFMGGFIIPVYPFLIWLLGGLFRIRGSTSEKDGPERRRRGSGSGDGGFGSTSGGEKGMRGWLPQLGSTSSGRPGRPSPSAR